MTGGSGATRRCGRRPRVAITALLLAAVVWNARSAAAAQEVVVSPDGPIRSIARAIGLAGVGGRVVVRPGVYREPTIVIDRPVEIVGRGEAVLDGEDERQIMTIRADGVVVRGLEFRNVGVSYLQEQAGVRVEDARDCVIADNRFWDTFFAIYLARAVGCRIVDNAIIGFGERETATGNGIHLWNCREILIEDNRVRGHRDGIYFEFVEDGVIRGNVAEDNLRYGLHFMFSDRNTYRNNVFRDNSAGVAVMYSTRTTMIENRFVDNWGSAAYGLLLKDIDDSHIYDNVLRGNTVGIFADGSNRTRIEGNELIDNGWAVRMLANSVDNLVTHNDFIGNSFDVSTNSRQNFSTFVENYWEEYEGYDLDDDGWGDVPYRPVQLFSLLVERNPAFLVLLRSPFVRLLDAAERVVPVLTPETLVDERPAMRPFR